MEDIKVYLSDIAKDYLVKIPQNCEKGYEKYFVDYNHKIDQYFNDYLISFTPESIKMNIDKIKRDLYKYSEFQQKLERHWL
jgi:hypothetical protein